MRMTLRGWALLIFGALVGASICFLLAMGWFGPDTVRDFLTGELFEELPSRAGGVVEEAVGALVEPIASEPAEPAGPETESIILVGVIRDGTEPWLLDEPQYVQGVSQGIPLTSGMVVTITRRARLSPQSTPENQLWWVEAETPLGMGFIWVDFIDLGGGDLETLPGPEE